MNQKQLNAAIAEAEAIERRVREHAYLDITSTVCGVELLPLSLRHCVMLIAIGSPFLCGKRHPDAQDVINFLWLLSPQWRTEQIRHDRKQRIRFARKVGAFDADKARLEINHFIETAFLDSPPQASSSRHVPKTSFVSSYVHTLAAHYGWSERHILEMPLACIFQYLRCISLERDPQCVLFNKFSDKVKRDYLKTLNDAARAAHNTGT